MKNMKNIKRLMSEETKQKQHDSLEGWSYTQELFVAVEESTSSIQLGNGYGDSRINFTGGIHDLRTELKNIRFVSTSNIIFYLDFRQRISNFPQFNFMQVNHDWFCFYVEDNNNDDLDIDWFSFMMNILVQRLLHLTR